MLILLFSFVLSIIFILLSIAAIDHDREVLLIISLLLGVIFIILFVVSGIAGFIARVDESATIVSLNEEYKSLTYQLDNIDTLYGNSCANDRKELFNQIEEWNTKIASDQLRHENLWTNWLYPIDYSQFKLIELS